MKIGTKERVVYSEGNLPPSSPGTKCTVEEGRTRQSESQQADINYIVKKFDATGQLPPGVRQGEYRDLSKVPELHEVLGTVSRAKEAFSALPEDVRAFFRNDPQRLISAWERGEHAEIFEEIGWLEKVPEADGEVKDSVAKATEDKPA